MTQFTFFVGQTTDGQWYAVRESEPLFCLPCKSEQDGVRIASETLEEYRRLFQGNEARETILAAVAEIRKRIVAYKRQWRAADAALPPTPEVPIAAPSPSNVVRFRR